MENCTTAQQALYTYAQWHCTAFERRAVYQGRSIGTEYDVSTYTGHDSQGWPASADIGPFTKIHEAMDRAAQTVSYWDFAEVLDSATGDVLVTFYHDGEFEVAKS